MDIQQGLFQDLFSKLPNTDSVPFFLWVSHGLNVEAAHNYYPMETKFNSLVFYSQPFDSIDTTLLNSFTTDPCRMLLGSCPKIPVTNKESNTKHVYLPPLVFSTSKDESHFLMSYIGLYFAQITKSGDSCSYLKPMTKLLYQKDLLEVQVKSHSQYMTYSTIYKIVSDKCKTLNINVEDVVLGIYSCQSEHSLYKTEYNTTIKDLVPKNVVEVKKANIFNNLNEIDESLYYSPTLIIFNKLKDWNALASIKTQGCGLNVLSYYDIIPQTDARAQTVCLTTKGTSIFKIVDYINDYAVKTAGIAANAYVIIRMNLRGALTVLFHFMKLFTYTQNYAVIFKLYNAEKEYNTDKYSQIGHTASLAKTADGKIYFIDPQQSIYQEITAENQLITFINNSYNNYYNFADIIYTVRPSPGFGDDSRPSDKITDLFDENIIPRPKDLTYGGKQRIKKTKRNKKFKKSKHNKKSKRNKKSKTQKNRKQKGGDLDPFEKLMVEIDSKYKIEPVIKVDSTPGLV